MPLTDLIHHLNRQQDSLPAGRFAARFLLSFDGRAFLHVANLSLESVFLPITSTASGRVQGHAAALRGYGLTTGNPVSQDVVFILPADNEEFVRLDRLLRTLHALNYLTGPVGGTLLLKVHRRHVMSVPSEHGLAFEEILRPCGFLPQQITLELDADGLPDVNHFMRAIASYRRRGYGIALSRFGRSSLDIALLCALQPDIVKLDPLLLASTLSIERLVEQIHNLGAKVAIEGPDQDELRRLGRKAGVDLVQPAQSAERFVSVSTRLRPGQQTLLRANSIDPADVV